MASRKRPLVEAFADPRSERRREDPRLLTGHGRYVGDLQPEGLLHAAVLRSPHAAARIRGIDVEAARSLPGVAAIFTAREVAAAGLAPMPCSLALDPASGLVVPPRPVLPADRVRHVGEPVAFVVAQSASAALEALEAIVVDYDPTDAVVDADAALAPGAPALWDEAPGNLAYHYRRGDAEATRAALAASAHVVELDLVHARSAAAALEPRCALATWDAAAGRGLLEVSAASVHMIRAELAAVMRVDPSRIDVACPDVGGGFGMKNVTYPEYALLLLAARELGRPVRWIAERSEDFQAGTHARAIRTTARLGLDADGRFTALDFTTVAHLGSHVSSLGPGSATTAITPAVGGLYAIPAVSLDVRGAFTNTAPIDAYRGAGKPEACYIVERLVDAAARRLGIDPVDLRRRNLIRTFPHRSAIGALFDGGEPLAAIDAALRLADRAGYRRRARQTGRAGRLRGFGLAMFLETSRGQPGEEAWIAAEPDGRFALAVGTQSNGQGHETSFVRLAADRLGIPAEAIRLVQADTRTVPRGGGHGGARSLHMGGAAILLAADDLVGKALPRAAGLLQSDPALLRFADGVFSVSGDAARQVALADLAEALAASGLTPLAQGHGDNRCDAYTFPNGCHVAEVEVDPETGVVSVERYVAVDDFGVLLNPLLTEGQVHGGLAQGIGQALLEEVAYDASSGQLQAATFMDYAVPRADDLPAFEIRFREVPTASNPMGAKGVGQAGAIAAPPVIVLAVLDALAPLGVTHLDMPLTPEKVWQAIRGAGVR